MKCIYCGNTGDNIKVFINKCLQKSHEIVGSPEYHGHEIHLDVGVDGPHNTFSYEKYSVSDMGQ